MSNVLGYQLSALDLLGVRASVGPPFTTHTYWPGIQYPCRICGVRGATRVPDVIGGNGRLPNDDWMTWRCCHDCAGKHGIPDPLNYPNLVVEHHLPFTVHLSSTFPKHQCGHCGKELTMAEGNGGGIQNLPDGRS